MTKKKRENSIFKLEPARKSPDDCSIESHSCFGRISAVLFDKRDIALKPPDYDERNIIELLEKYSDAHILDSGWREVDPEEWIEK